MDDPRKLSTQELVQLLLDSQDEASWNGIRAPFSARDRRSGHQMRLPPESVPPLL